MVEVVRGAETKTLTDLHIKCHNIQKITVSGYNAAPMEVLEQDNWHIIDI